MRRLPKPIVIVPVVIVPVVIVLVVIAFVPSSADALDAAPLKRLLLLGQKPDGHPPGTHEYLRGVRVLAGCLEGVSGLQVTVASADDPWSQGPTLLEKADAVVIFVSEGARWIHAEPKRIEAFRELAARGGGIIALHWGMGTRDAKNIETFLELVGGCHGGPDRRYKVVETPLEVADKTHPITSGITDFPVREELYYKLKFVRSTTRVQPVLRASVEGNDEVVAWSWERPDGGRSFGYSGLHFHDNWHLPQYRRLLAQAVLWSLKMPVPEDGLTFELDVKEASPFEVAAKPELVLERGAGEGPAWHPEQGVLFSGGGNIHRLDRHGKLHVLRERAGTNGLLFDRQGRLLACEPGSRRVTRREDNGTIHVLTERYEGKRYNTPNDITVDSKGRIYFSDPRYGRRDDMEIRDADGKEVEGVYRIDPDGSVERIITHEADRPNGVLVSRDDRYLFVADNNNDTVGGARKLWRFDLRADGRVAPSSRKLLLDWGTARGPDGLVQDVHGRLYVAGGLNKPNAPYETAKRYRGGVYVLSPDGAFLDFVPIPRDEVTNCTFGDDDLRTLYITAGGTLWKIRAAARGWGPGAR